MKFLDVVWLSPLLLGIGLIIKGLQASLKLNQLADQHTHQPELEAPEAETIDVNCDTETVDTESKITPSADTADTADVQAKSQIANSQTANSQITNVLIDVPMPDPELPDLELSDPELLNTPMTNPAFTKQQFSANAESGDSIEAVNVTESAAANTEPTEQLEPTEQQAPDMASPQAETSHAAALPPEPAQILPLIPLGDPTVGIVIEDFKQAFTANLLRRGQSVQTATAAESYAILAEMLRDRLMQIYLDTDLAANSLSRRLVIAIAPEFALGMPLENHFTRLNLIQPIQQGLAELGIDFVQIAQQDQAQGTGDDGVGCLMGSYLESLATAHIPTIGYGLHPKLELADESAELAADLTADLTADSATNVATDLEANLNLKTQPAPAQQDESPWEVKQADQSLTVKFGGYAEIYLDQQGYCRRGWTAAEVARAVPYDLLVSGHQVQTDRAAAHPLSSLLRLWRVSPAMSPLAGADPAELKLRRDFLLVSCAVQDVIRRHLAADLPLSSLPESVVIQLNDASTVLTIAELMHQLVDRQGLDWEPAWAMTEAMVSCTLHSLTDDEPGDYSLSLLHRLLPRHLEIIHEINRRFLDAARAHSPNLDESWIGRLSLVDYSQLRSSHLALVGSYSFSGSSLFHIQFLQERSSDLSQLYPNKFRPKTAGITPRRFLLQTHPALANLITQWIGDTWITRPEQLQQLEPLVNDAKFCGSWWQVRRDAKQILANKIQQKTGLNVNLSTLFDIQAGTITASSRQLLHLLHVITLYARLKINSSTDTIQRFTHRSVPRTCIFVGQPAANPIAQLTAALIRAVASTINQDSDVQSKLQVMYLEDSSPQLERWVYPAADLAEQLDLAGQTAVNVTALKFAMNGAVTIGPPNYSNLALRQAVGAKNLFLGGMTAAEVKRCRSSYSPQQHYSSDPDLKQALDLIATGYFSAGDGSVFRPLVDWLLSEDPYLILADYSAYITAQERVSQVCQDQKIWVWMSILTVANSGQFSSDCAIADYQQN